MNNRIKYQSGQSVGENGITFVTETSIQINKAGRRKRMATFQCHCGDTFTTRIDTVRSNITKSCGCSLIKHGLRYHPGYLVWKNMHYRCQSEPSYVRKNILVCEEWNELNPQGLQNFCRWWDQIYPGGKLTIERVVNQDGYHPDNCTFISQSEQVYNQEKNINNKSGYTGVCWSKEKRKWDSEIKYLGKKYRLGRHTDINAAVTARNNFIIDNNLQDKFPIQEIQ